jgi:hypothetical protein
MAFNLKEDLFMYTQLKQVMRDHGYKPTEGGHWTGHDTQEFTTFAHFILAVPRKIAHRFLSYPRAFPDAIKRLEAMVGIGGAIPSHETTSAPVETPLTPEPAAAPVATVADATVFDVSGKAPEAPAPVAAPEVVAPVVNETPTPETPPETPAPVEGAASEPVVTEGQEPAPAPAPAAVEGDAPPAAQE